MSPGVSSRGRYTKTCTPTLGGYSRKGLIRNATVRSAYGSVGGDVLPYNSNHKGGATNVVATLSQLLAPLGNSELATLVVLLFLNHWTKRNKKYQKGGDYKQYLKLLLPMGKNNLVVLASLLLLNYLSKTTSSRKQQGGSDLYPYLDQLLAPLGVNAFGASWLLVILNYAFNNKGKTKKGGSLNNGQKYISDSQYQLTYWKYVLTPKQKCIF